MAKSSRLIFLAKVFGILFAFFILGFMMGRCSGRRVERRHAAKEDVKIEVTAQETQLEARQEAKPVTKKEAKKKAKKEAKQEAQQEDKEEPKQEPKQEAKPVEPVEPQKTEPEAVEKDEIQYVQSNFYGLPKRFEQHFNDLQDSHLAYAEKYGVRPFTTRASIEERTPAMIASGSLVKIQTNALYCVDELTSSHPYVVPRCAKFLDELARRFQTITESKSRFCVSSVLRTDEDIRRLQGKNGNVTVNSAHRYGTTIDIAYARYEIDPARPIRTPELRLALAEVLREMQKEGKCLVKIEKKQYCYHITIK